MVLKRESSKAVDALPSEDTPLHRGNLRGFFRYMNMRHNIYIRRHIKKKKPPWTKDSILQEYKFTNVYRRLDRGSQWMIKNIIQNDDAYPKKGDKVWACILYRIANEWRTFQAIGIPRRKDFNPKVYRKLMEVYRGKGKDKKRVFTNAHITCQSNMKRTRIENYIEIATRLKANWKEFWAAIKQCKKDNDWEACYKMIHSHYGFGPFTSYEVCIDMVYAGIFPDKIRNSFANPGPGCQYGLMTIFPSNRKSIAQFKKDMRKLTEHQDHYFDKFNIKFRGPYLTIQDIEFNLCEWSKYFKITKSVGKARMKFVPTE